MQSVDEVAAHIVARAGDARRHVVAIAGAPGSGKSTLVETLKEAVDALLGREGSVIVPMDGFHYDNAVLDLHGQRARKGAPDTFDVSGYAETLRRIRAADGPVAVPVFDRGLDLARAGGRLVEPRHRIVLTEGNYLLSTEPPWSALRDAFDLTIFVDVPEIVLERRLISRWLDNGHDRHEAIRRARANDLVNARFVKATTAGADIVIAPFPESPIPPAGA